nr:MAG TPA_asm: hypothetical protein [Caudoviricetes sp.]
MFNLIKPMGGGQSFLELNKSNTQIAGCYYG